MRNNITFEQIFSVNNDENELVCLTRKIDKTKLKVEYIKHYNFYSTKKIKEFNEYDVNKLDLIIESLYSQIPFCEESELSASYYTEYSFCDFAFSFRNSKYEIHFYFETKKLYLRNTINYTLEKFSIYNKKNAELMLEKISYFLFIENRFLDIIRIIYRHKINSQTFANILEDL